MPDDKIEGSSAAGTGSAEPSKPPAEEKPASNEKPAEKRGHAELPADALAAVSRRVSSLERKTFGEGVGFWGALLIAAIVAVAAGAAKWAWGRWKALGKTKEQTS